MSVESFYEILQVVQDENQTNSKFFPERLRSFRIARNLGQSELGKVVGRTASTISDWEKGKTQPSLRDVELLAKRLDVSPGRLAFGDEETTKVLSDPQMIDVSLAPDLHKLLHNIIHSADRDESRLGWIREQLRQHLRIPAHWAETDEDTARLVRAFIEESQRLRDPEQRPKSG